MKRFYYYFRLQYRLLSFLLCLELGLAYLCLVVVGLGHLPSQLLLFGTLLFLRLGFTSARRNPLQINLKKYVQKVLKRIPSNRDMAGWQGLNKEAQDVVFILTGLIILALRFVEL